MATNYIVKQFDHLSNIADKFGFRDFKTIWDHPENAGLKKQRVDPHVLFPGDHVYIPDKEPKNEPVATTKVHRFKMGSPLLMLRIVLKDFDEAPIADADCILSVGGEAHSVKSDASGMVQVRIPVSAKSGTLKVPGLDIDVPIEIGHLDPAAEDRGSQARLINLGFLSGAVGSADKEEVARAIEEFQCDHDLPVTGKLDAASLAKLKAAHGS
jgi:Putative peptidoglycan binding domain